MAISASTFGNAIGKAWNSSSTGAFFNEFFNWDNWSKGFNKALNDFGAGINRLTGVEASNQAAAANAADQRRWEEDMDNTKYQRAVQDMKAAGLNPAMLTGLSSSSVGSAPSGASASTHGPSGNIIGSLLSLVALLALKKKA